MAQEFIKAGINKQYLSDAAKQERQLCYFTQSDLQDDNLTSEYLTQWAERNYKTNDYFLNFVKNVFKTENFLSFFKYMRKPLPSTKLINNKIKPQLKRVFTSENADFKYDVTGVDLGDIKELLNNKDFQEDLFNHILFNHNAILIEDLEAEEVNSPYRCFLNIADVVSLDHDGKRITKIAYKSVYEGEYVIVYIDDDVYSVYDKEYNLISEVPHDLGECPADFITKNKYKNNFIIRESIFTYIREELEEYVFLKTLQRMTEPNGAIPVVTKLEVSSDDEGDIDRDQPNSDTIMGSQKAQLHSDNNNKQSGDLQAGTIHEIPLDSIMNVDGNLNMDAVKDFLNFFYVPIEALEYLKARINEIELSIISTMVGLTQDFADQAINEAQVEYSIITLENTLINLADTLNKIRKESDYKMLALAYGKERVNEVFIFYGTDFFLESQSRLYEDLEKAPNPIERKNILVRINQNKYKNNQDQMLRQKILYDLLPFVSDSDFEIAREAGLDNITLQYQLRFTYWIGLFEAQYGDIVSFYINLEGDEATKLRIINELIIDIIKQSTMQKIEGTGEDLSDQELEDQRVKIEAQSRLKGTVGGVDGILGIQEKVSQGITSFDAAVKILNEIYGFDDKTAKELLGKKQIINT